MFNARVLALAVILAASALPLAAHDERPRQKGTRMMRFDADKAVMIDEAAMVVSEKDGKLKVQFIAPAERRPAETAGLDIAEGDEVGMAAGKRVSTVKELRDAYEKVKPGEEMKLGLRRNGESYIVAFKRMDPKDLPGRRIIRAGNDDPDTDVLPALGLVIRQKDGKVVVDETLPNAPKETSTGDIIVSLNGKRVQSLKDFSGVFDKVETGGTLKFELLRDGKTVTFVTKRPKPQGRMIVE